MPLGFHDPTWSALYAALDELAKETGARCVAIIDAWNDIWCVAPATHDKEVFALLEHVFVTHVEHAGLEKGHPLSLTHRGETSELAYTVESFATVYVAILVLADEAKLFAAHASLKAALPRIEELTTALPPSDGPDDTSGAMSRRG